MGNDVSGSDPSQLSGRFCVETELARGGMGTVFVALDTATGNRIALKRLVRDVPPRVAALFEREFCVLSSLKHPRIIEVYEYGMDAHGPFYTMELLEGSDLRDLSPLPPLAACRYLRDVASSLALLHARRLLHRDVSPRNVRTLPHGGCKLIDFGALTSFGTNEELVGTPPAIPPEALSGVPLDQRSDLFALGALAYFMLTGEHAYPARTLQALPDAWLARVALPSQYVAEIPSELDQLVMTLLNLDALARPSSAAEVIDRLNAIAGLPPDHDEQIARSYFTGTPLVERERELSRVQRRIQRAKAQNGGCLFVDGQPGVGKSRLLDEIALKAQLGGMTALRLDAAQHAGPLSTARALVQQLLRLLPRLSTKVFGPRAARLEEVWVDMFAGLVVSSERRHRPRRPARAGERIAGDRALCARRHAQADADDRGGQRTRGRRRERGGAARAGARGAARAAAAVRDRTRERRARSAPRAARLARIGQRAAPACADRERNLVLGRSSLRRGTASAPKRESSVRSHRRQPPTVHATAPALGRERPDPLRRWRVEPADRDPRRGSARGGARRARSPGELFAACAPCSW